MKKSCFTVIFACSTFLKVYGISIFGIEIGTVDFKDRFHTAVAPGEKIVVNTLIWSDAVPPPLSKPTTVTRDRNRFFIDIFVENAAGHGGFWVESTELAPLPMGDYLIDVSVHSEPPESFVEDSRLWHVVSVRPALKAEKRGDEIVLRWPDEAWGYMLEKTDLGSFPIKWSLVGAPIVREGTNNVVTLKTPEKATVFRLHKYLSLRPFNSASRSVPINSAKPVAK